MVELVETDIKNMIYTIRGQQVMLDSDLAKLYGYETKNLNRQVKRNIEKFPEDMMFQLTFDETIGIPRCQNGTMEGKGSNIKYAPYVFTEQGIYMLATVLKGELATKQTLKIIRLFKKMRQYVIENKYLLNTTEYEMLSKRIDTNVANIESINNKIDSIMDNFIDETKIKEFVFVDGQKFEADEAYINLYRLAKKSIYVVNDYVSIKTLSHLKYKDVGVNAILFTDNKSKRDKLQQVEVVDFNNEYPLLEVKETNGMVHDRLIVIDYGTNNEKIYLCGASSKDAGAKFCTILEVHNKEAYHGIMDKLLLNKLLIL